MTSLREAWSALLPRLKILEPVPFSPDQWSLLEGLRENFNDRVAHTHLPIAIAGFRDTARQAIHAEARQLDDVRTVYVDDKWLAEAVASGEPDTVPHDRMAHDRMAPYVRLYNDDVDALMSVLVPAARYRKAHYAYGRFVVPQPHGLHTDHSAEDPQAAGEPICIARIASLGTHYVGGDYRAHDPATRSRLNALRYWMAVPEGPPEAIFDALLEQGTLQTIPVDHVVLMVAGNSSDDAQITQHIAARPPEGGVHSAFFQRQYRLGGPTGNGRTRPGERP